MFTYIFVNHKGKEIARRETDVEVGINGFIKFENYLYRVSPMSSNENTLVCALVQPGLVKYDPVVELVEFFKASGINTITPTNINEMNTKEAFLSLLSPTFKIEREVSGVLTKFDQSTSRLRIDAVVTPLENEHTKQYKNHRPISFGIEFKNPKKIGKGPKDPGNSMSEILSQCTDYTNCNFKGHGRIPVFTFPFFNHRVHSQLLNYVAKSHLGVITTHHSGGPHFAFRLGEMSLWDSIQGFTDLGQKIKFERKYGNRS